MKTNSVDLPPDIDRHKTKVGIVKPALNYRRTQVRCCGSCRYLVFPGDGVVECSRPRGPVFDATDQQWWEHVCDRFVRHVPGENEL